MNLQVRVCVTLKSAMIAEDVEFIQSSLRDNSINNAKAYYQDVSEHELKNVMSCFELQRK